MTTTFTFRLDETVKQEAETLFAELGLNMSTALNAFLKTAIREQGIPFPMSLDLSTIPPRFRKNLTREEILQELQEAEASVTTDNTFSLEEAFSEVYAIIDEAKKRRTKVA